MRNSPIDRRLKKYRVIESEMDFLETELWSAKEMLKTMDEFKIRIEEDVQEKVDKRIQGLEEELKNLEVEKEFIESLIDKLSDNEVKQIFKYRYFSGLPWMDIAKKTGSSERQVRRIHQNALEKIESEKTS